MRRHRLPLALSILLPAVAMAGQPTFLKMTVQEKGYTEPNVKINLPLSLIEAVADSIKDEQIAGVDKVLMDIKTDGVDLVKLWQNVKKLGPTDFVEVEDEKEHVKVWKDHEAFRITVTDKGQSEPKVMIMFPLAIVDSIFGDGTKPVTLRSIVDALKSAGPMEFVEVKDGGDAVRIWLE